MTKVFLGVDPGLTGALAWYCPEHDALLVEDMPTTQGTRKKFVAPDVLASIVQRQRDAWLMKYPYDNVHVFGVVERVSAAPDQGVTSMFNFGMGFGIVLGVLAASRIPARLVPPSVWKAELNVPADKHGSMTRACRLLPKHGALWPRMMDNGRAEAAMIALWGSRQV